MVFILLLTIFLLLMIKDIYCIKDIDGNYVRYGNSYIIRQPSGEELNFDNRMFYQSGTGSPLLFCLEEKCTSNSTIELNQKVALRKKILTRTDVGNIWLTVDNRHLGATGSWSVASWFGFDNTENTLCWVTEGSRLGITITNSNSVKSTISKKGNNYCIQVQLVLVNTFNGVLNKPN